MDFFNMNAYHIVTSRLSVNGSAVEVIFIPPPKYLAFPMHRAVTLWTVLYSPPFTYHVQLQD
jgi:hypothetical protein